jgi:hypothetical protein
MRNAIDLAELAGVHLIVNMQIFKEAFFCGRCQLYHVARGKLNQS